MNEHRVWLPFPPSVNNAFSQGLVRGKIRRFPSKPYKRWRNDAMVYILAARPKLPRFTEPVVVKVELTPRDSRPRDADNYNKPVIDALVAARILPGDDQRWVKAVIAYWCDPAPQPGAVVTIRLAKGVTEPLDAAERYELARVKRAGSRLVGPAHRPSKATQGLVEKGRIRELPGLFNGVTQGYAPSD